VFASKGDPKKQDAVTKRAVRFGKNDLTGGVQREKGCWRPRQPRGIPVLSNVDINYSCTTIKKRTLDARDAERNSKPGEEETKVRTQARRCL
jgi:hypothetical protein